MSKYKEKINIVSLGCSKNLVDAENLMGLLEANNISVVFDSNSLDAKTVIINTCGFIENAKKESIDTILQFAKAKRRGDVNNIFIMGCLSERYKNELQKELPEVDEFFGKFDWKTIAKRINHKAKINDIKYTRKITTPKHYAYLKISEGCDRVCSFCAIPFMTGKHVSKPIKTVIDEVKKLVDNGTKEFLVIAQELTYYGLDLYKKRRIAELIEQIANIKGVDWIRLHYAYPHQFPKDLLPVINNHRNVCSYLDIALQHSSNRILKLMKRNITREETIDLIHQIREQVPNIALRTTMLVGHPEETEQDFEDLANFVEKMKFERLGVFPYSNEDNTFAFKNYKDNVPNKVKLLREEKIMNIQQGISLQYNESKIGATLKTIIDRKEQNYYIGRTEYDSPEIDPEVMIRSNTPLTTGNFYNVKITSADAYDLYGEV